MRQTKNFKPFFALAESLPTFATLIHSEHQCTRMVLRVYDIMSHMTRVLQIAVMWRHCVMRVNLILREADFPGATSLWNIIEVVLSGLWACQGG